MKSKVVLGAIAMSVVSLFACVDANAHGSSFNYWQESGFTRHDHPDGYYFYRHHHRYYSYMHRVYPVVVAACTTSQTIQPLPTYVCCELESKGGHHIWRDTWVSGSCKAANMRAYHDEGCTMNSPVYGTGAPILQRGQCQFSNTTGKYL